MMRDPEIDCMCDACLSAPDSDAESTSKCPACGEPIDYCQGRGEIGDPVGASILAAHDDGYHGRCDPAGCDDRRAMLDAVTDRYMEGW